MAENRQYEDTREGAAPFLNHPHQRQQQEHPHERRRPAAAHDDSRKDSSYYGPPPEKRYRRGDEDDNARRYRGYPPETQRGGRTGGAVGRGGGGGGASSSHHSHDNYHYGRREENESSSGGVVSPDWKCLECLTWNHPRDMSCMRCGAPSEAYRYRGPENGFGDRRDRDRGPPLPPHPRRMHGGNSDSEERGSRASGSENEEAVDEFGRNLSPKPEATKMNPARAPRVWPLPFESNGPSYVLDNRSGMFYDGECDFFYDPKSKLYYGNKERAYFRYDANDKPPFVKVDLATATGPNDTTQPEATLLLPASTKDQGKTKETKSISIKLKTKSFKTNTKKKEASENQETSASIGKSNEPSVPKKHANDISKWQERQNEKRQEAGQAAKPAGAVSNNEDEVVTKTPKGEPICTLCRRKFPSIEKLRYHERASKLHQENLAKKKKTEEEQATKAPAAEATAAPEAPAYVDRAQERRNMYEATDDPSLLLATSSASVATEPAVPQTEVVKPQDTLGESNIGNQLLQKLGWKSGNGLGRQARGASFAAGDDGTQTIAHAASVAKEWERIESLASSGSHGGNGTSSAKIKTHTSSQGGLGSSFIF